MTSMQLQCFLEASRYENFTEAARALFVTQPALSRQIAVLEEELGVVLFERRNNRIHLTAAGQELRVRLLPLCEQYQQAVEAVRMVADGTSGSLTIGVLEDHQFPPTLQDSLAVLMRRWPELCIEVETRPHRTLNTGIASGELDAIYTVLPEENDLVDDRLSMRILAQYPAYLAVREDLPLPRDVVTPETLGALSESVPLLLLSPKTVAFPGVHEGAEGVLYAEPYVALHKRFVASVGTLEFYLRAGAGMALVTPANRLSRLEGIRLVRLEAAEHFRLGLLWREDSPNPALRKLLTLLEN